MTYLRNYFFIFVFFLISPIANATPESELNALLTNLNSMQAGFVQTVYDNHGKPIQKAQGKMQFQRPGKFRWETFKPTTQLIVANGSRLWIYDADLAQVTIRSLEKEVGEAPALLLSHVTTEHYDIKKIQGASNLTWFKLIPKNRESLFAVIQLGFASDQLREMRLQDQLGHTTRLQFNQIVKNPSLPPALFIFKSPANVDVIDETSRR